MKPLTYDDLPSLKGGDRLKVIDVPDPTWNISVGDIVVVSEDREDWGDPDMVYVICRDGESTPYFPHRFTRYYGSLWMDEWLLGEEKEHD